MEFLKINIYNIDIIKNFFNINNSIYFTYYKTRIYENAIKNHVYTVIAKYNSDIIGYGHIDYQDKYWIGLYIHDNYQNKGYGKILLNHLIKISKELFINNLYLSVNIENTIAIHIYNKFGFKVIKKNNKNIIMCLTDENIYLPTSYGEAYDKLSILEIKLNKIKDNRIIDVQKEYDIINNTLRNFNTNNINFYFNILKKINLNIWDKQDLFRYTNDQNLKNNLCIEIISENDRRFRVKNKINNLLNSQLKEQKGYNKKNAVILTHLGLGDNITAMGIVRYYSTLYDEIYVVCKKKYEYNIKLLYKDDETIHTLPLDIDVENKFGFNLDNVNCDLIKTGIYKSVLNNFCFNVNDFNYDLIKTGIYKNKRSNFNTIPFCFYKDLELDYSIFWDYSYVIDTTESKELYNELVKFNINEYIICQTGTSNNSQVFTMENIKIDINKILVINIEKNIYNKDHIFYNIADKFVMQPLINYKDTIINASEIYTTDSCLFTISILLNIKTDKCYVISRNKNNNYDYIFTNYFKFNSNKNKKFINFNI